MFATLGILTWDFVAAPQCTQALAGGTEGCTLASELNSPLLSSSGGWVAVAMLNLYVAFFATTWGPIVWVLLGEMFPNKIRAAAMSVAVAANWLANFAVTESFKPLIDNFGLGVAYGLFTLGALVSFFYVSKFVKETKRASSSRTWTSSRGCPQPDAVC